LRDFFKRTGQPLMQDWLVEMVKRLFRGLPLKLMMTMGLGSLFRPRTRGWRQARAAIEEYVHEQEVEQRRALGLDRADAVKQTEAAE
jgi:heterodisulfide reductase subunit C